MIVGLLTYFYLKEHNSAQHSLFMSVARILNSIMIAYTSAEQYRMADEQIIKVYRWIVFACTVMDSLDTSNGLLRFRGLCT